MPQRTGVVKPEARKGVGSATDTGPLEDLNTLQKEVHSLFHDQLQLAAIEVRLAAKSLVVMIVAAICIGLLLLLVWVGMMSTIGLILTDLGLRPVFAILLITALTAITALPLYGLIKHRSGDLALPATMRSLKPRQQIVQGGQIQHRSEHPQERT